MERHQTKKHILAAIQPSVLSLGESQQLVTHGQATRDYDSENAQITIENRRAKQAFRMKWDTLLSRAVVAGFILSYLMIFLIGTHKLTFQNSSLAVPSVVAVGIVQTYGLAKLAVSYFFSEDNNQGKE
jgi:hypothetical protein